MILKQYRAQIFRSFGLSFILFLSLVSCIDKTTVDDNKTLAQVGNKTLFTNDVISQIPSHLNQNDSIQFIEDFIQRWIKQQLLVNEAENKLSSEQRDVQQELERYKEELIIYKYQNERTSEIVNHAVPYESIESYYNEHIDQFKLTANIVRADYMILPSNTKPTANIRKIALSDDLDDIKEFELYAYSNAKRYENFNANWIYFNTILSRSEFEIEDEIHTLQRNKIIEFTKNNETHFIVIRDYKLAGQTAPIDFVEPQIRYLLINKKKLDFLREIKDSLYTDALKYNKFRVFN